MTKHWVDEFLVPLHACQSGIDKARQYPDPQLAWDDWDDGCELLWTLGRWGERDSQKLVLCACDIAERALPIFEKEYPDDLRPREAIEAARRWAENPTKENRKNVKIAADAVAYCATNAARAAYNVANAAYYTANAASGAYYAARAADVKAGEAKAQADIVRKYFPVSPFVRKENNDDGQ